MQKRVTLRDVALHAGVSLATASRALNSDPAVTGHTARAVIDAASALNYRLGQPALETSAEPTNLVCLIVPSFSQRRLALDYYAKLISGVEETANDLGLHLLIKNKTETQSISELVENRHAFGFVVRIGHSQTEELKLIRQLRQHKIPTILVGNPSKKVSSAHSIRVDSVGGAREVAHHFADRGFKKLLFISGPRRNVESKDRWYGFHVGLRERGYRDESVVYADGDYTPQSGFQAARDHIVKERIDAVFACNDHMALGVLTYCSSAGIQIPDDVAVVGFDDQDFAAYTWPSLTTVRQPVYQLGEQALRELVAHRRDRATARSGVILSPTLIVRRSSDRR